MQEFECWTRQFNRLIRRVKGKNKFIFMHFPLEVTHEKPYILDIAKEVHMARKAKISAKVRATVLARDNHICRACGFGGSENYAFALHCDHIVPESAGGATAMDNLQCLCAACNGAKGDRVAHQFAVRAATQPEEIWSQNQRVVAQAFSTSNASIRARILRALR
jgi:hypothetical protein